MIIMRLKPNSDHALFIDFICSLNQWSRSISL